MASASEHSEVVLASILKGRRDLLERALQGLNPTHFPERVHAMLFTMLQRYSDATAGSVMPLKFLDDNLRGRADPGQVQLYTETYRMLASKPTDDSEFAWSVQQLRDLTAEQRTGEAITEAMQILRQGKQFGQDVLRGHSDARMRILESFQEIDRDLTQQDAPEGDMRNEGPEMMSDYADRKFARERGLNQGITFGVTELDRKVNGMQPGELILVAGYSSDGKTSFAVQAAWSAAVEQGRNVAFLTTETLRPQVRRKVLARHSKLPQFEIPDGLNTRDLKAGTLTPEQEGMLHTVVSDFTNNPAYGQVYIAQIPRAAGIASIEQRLNRIQRRFNIDLVVMDYLALLVSERRRNSMREELSEVLKNAKLLSVGFDNGRGVPFISPWQVSRAARESAETLGQYTSAALSETAEATNSADIILSLLAPSDNTERRTDITMQILKNRDGETANGITVEVDYATCHFRSRRLATDVLRARDTNLSSGFSLDSLLTD